jgi:hypothetical protein
MRGRLQPLDCGGKGVKGRDAAFGWNKTRPSPGARKRPQMSQISADAAFLATATVNTLEIDSQLPYLSFSIGMPHDVSTPAHHKPCVKEECKDYRTFTISNRLSRSFIRSSSG